MPTRPIESLAITTESTGSSRPQPTTRRSLLKVIFSRSCASTIVTHRATDCLPVTPTASDVTSTPGISPGNESALMESGSSAPILDPSIPRRTSRPSAENSVTQTLYSCSRRVCFLLLTNLNCRQL